MNLRLIVRPEAEAEMADAFDWYEGHVPGLGSDFFALFGCRFQRNYAITSEIPFGSQDRPLRTHTSFPIRGLFCGGRRTHRRPVCFSCQA